MGPDWNKRTPKGGPNTSPGWDNAPLGFDCEFQRVMRNGVAAKRRFDSRQELAEFRPGLLRIPTGRRMSRESRFPKDLTRDFRVQLHSRARCLRFCAFIWCRGHHRRFLFGRPFPRECSQAFGTLRKCIFQETATEVPTTQHFQSEHSEVSQ